MELAQVQHKYFEFINNNGGWPAAEKKVSAKFVMRKSFVVAYMFVLFHRVS